MGTVTSTEKGQNSSAPEIAGGGGAAASVAPVVGSSAQQHTTSAPRVGGQAGGGAASSPASVPAAQPSTRNRGAQLTHILFNNNYQTNRNIAQFLDINERNALHEALSNQSSAIVEERESRIASKLLLCVARGEQEKAERLLRKFPKWMLERGKATDYSGRVFENTSPFEYALWAGDRHMWDMMMNCIPQGDEGIEFRAELLKQYERVTQQGLDYHYIVEVGPRKGERVEVVNETAFNYQPLLNAYDTYIKSFDPPESGRWDWDRRDKYWCTVVGLAQRMLPAHVLHEYCHPERSFYPNARTPDFKEPTLPRSLRIYNLISGADETVAGHGEASFAAGFGLDFALVRRRDSAWAGGVRMRMVGGYVAPDFAAVTALCEVRARERLDLSGRLQPTENLQSILKP